MINEIILYKNNLLKIRFQFLYKLMHLFTTFFLSFVVFRVFLKEEFTMRRKTQTVRAMVPR